MNEPTIVSLVFCAHIFKFVSRVSYTTYIISLYMHMWILLRHEICMNFVSILKCFTKLHIIINKVIGLSLLATYMLRSYVYM